MEKIGTIIRKHRTALGLTQEELSNKVFVSKQAISKWETGKTLPDIEMLRKLCVILQINNDEILDSTISETKKSRIIFRILIAISILSILLAFFFGLGGIDMIYHRTQFGVAYVTVFDNEELLTTEKYVISSNQIFEDFKNGYKTKVGYGELKGTILYDNYNVEFGFNNTNNWHNIHIRLDLTKQENNLLVKQTISFETDNKTYQIFVTTNQSNNNQISVFKEGV